MITTRKQHPTLVYEDLTVKIIRGKFGEYTYKSPLYGYKRAYKYNLIIYIYITGRDGWLDTHLFKNATRKEIIEFLRGYKATSRRYLKEIQKISSPVSPDR